MSTANGNLTDDAENLGRDAMDSRAASARDGSEVHAVVRRHRDIECGAYISLTRDLYLAIMGFHNAVEHSESETNSLAVRLGGEKWIENLGEVFGRDTFATVFYAVDQ